MPGNWFHDLHAVWHPRHPMHTSGVTIIAFLFAVVMFSPYAFTTLTIKALDSGIMVLASPTVGVSRFALSPPLPSSGNCQPKCHGRPTWCTVEPATLKGLNRFVTIATALTSPRPDFTMTFSPFAMPFSFASSTLISTNIWGCISSCHDSCLVMTPVCQCSDTRYVVATKGYWTLHEKKVSSLPPNSLIVGLIRCFDIWFSSSGHSSAS